jgi:hypothetical protein
MKIKPATSEIHTSLNSEKPHHQAIESRCWLRVAVDNEANLVFSSYDKDMVRVAVTKARTQTSSDIQLNLPHLKVKSNHRYTIKFRAQADSPRTIFLGFALAYEPWTGLGLYRGIELTSEWQDFQEDFVATTDEENARIHFDLGGSDKSVELSSVTLLSLPDGKTIEPDYERFSKWDYRNVVQFPYGDDTTYQKGIAFLDGYGTIEDWGCGTAYAKNFVKGSKYIGIDGSHSNYADKVVNLVEYTSETDCIFMRHVLEHNYNWRKILANAVNSFTKRMVLIIFTPFTEETRQIAFNQHPRMPDISFRKEELIEFFKQFNYHEESLETDTQYKTEHIFYIEK